MEKFNKILLLLIITLIVFSVGYTIWYRKAKNNINDNIIIQDTTYNHIILDSIKYCLIEKDEPQIEDICKNIDVDAEEIMELLSQHEGVIVFIDVCTRENAEKKFY